MSFYDLREFLSLLDSQGELHRIETKVDPDWEVGAICRENFDRKGPALQFNRVGNYRTPLVVGVLGKENLYGLALGVSPVLRKSTQNGRRRSRTLLNPSC